MPDLGQLVVLLVVLLGAGLVVAAPLRWSIGNGGAPSIVENDAAGLALRHRIAVESLRDVEADRRAGSLDDEGYQVARAEAEARAARTLSALEAARRVSVAGAAEQAHGQWTTWRVASVLGVAIAALVLVGSFLPAPLTLANGTVVNTQLAAQQAAEAARQREISRLKTVIAAKPEAATLVQLADLYLQNGSAADLQQAAQWLIFAIQLDPKSSDAYRLLITAYIQAGDYTDATAATAAYARFAPSSPDIAFFRGLIAYQGSGDRVEAVRWFDAFLKLAPNDARAPMVRSLRAEAAGQLPGGATPSPSP